MLLKPLFIVFEGIDGSGKTRQALMLSTRLEQCGIRHILTAEPSDSPVGKQIRSMKSRPAAGEEAGLFMADRKYHLEQVILPALSQGKTVICDRYVYSSVAYQGARGLDPARLLEDNRRFARPADVTFLLEIPVEQGLARIRLSRGAELSPFENVSELEAVADLYRCLDDASIERLDGTLAAEEVHRKVVSSLQSRGLCDCP